MVLVHVGTIGSGNESWYLFIFFFHIFPETAIFELQPYQFKKQGEEKDWKMKLQKLP